ncbi:MAG: hypothetical protein A2X08_16845 [Bacteroidetes bacterium GWA2_32_17]|nr:MAG: hypothetical protein A2X08_16845 [Bacteroidetes bacterium GWA2_32_17]
MLKSMTGYGKTVTEFNGKKITVEIKSLNSKQADVYIKTPLIYREKETEIRNETIKKLERGKIEFSIYIENNGNNKNITINKELFAEYYEQLKKIKDELFPNQNPDWTSIITQLPETLSQKNEELDEQEWKTIHNAIINTIDLLDNYRTIEGNTLENEIISHVTKIEELHLQVTNYEKERIETIKNRISQNLNDVIGNEGFDKNRFEQELIYYLEKIDITEERVRLTNNCKYFKETCSENNPGRKLGFIAQEIGREINTLGSKANHSEIQKIVVQMKDELEKVKEQLLNIL